jgi:hypothetical protein
MLQACALPRMSDSQLNHEQRNVITGQIVAVQFSISAVWAIYMFRPEWKLLPIGVAVAVPMICFGVMMMLGTYVKGLIPWKSDLSIPRWTFPILWALMSYLIVQVAKVQESATTALPEVLQRLAIWGDLRMIIPNLILQTIGLSFLSAVVKRHNQSS